MDPTNYALLKNIKPFMRIWFWIAVACCILCVIATGLALYVQWKNHCRPELLGKRPLNDFFATLFSSAFMIFFFVRAGSKSGIASAREAATIAEYQFPVLHDRLPLTGVHLIIHLNLMCFCALTLAGPGYAFISLRWVFLTCGHPQTFSIM